jgi:hypothetical protein
MFNFQLSIFNEKINPKAHYSLLPIHYFKSGTPVDNVYPQMQNMRTVLTLRSFVELTQGFDQNSARLTMNQKTYDRLIILNGVSGYRKFNRIPVSIDENMHDDVIAVNSKTGTSELIISYS